MPEQDSANIPAEAQGSWFHRASGKYMFLHELNYIVSYEWDHSGLPEQSRVVVRDAFSAAVDNKNLIRTLGDIGALEFEKAVRPLIESCRMAGRANIKYTNIDREYRKTAEELTRDLNRRKYDIRKKVNWLPVTPKDYFDDHIEMLLLSCVVAPRHGQEIEDYEPMKSAWEHYGLVTTIGLYRSGIPMEAIAKAAKDDIDSTLLISLGNAV